MTAYAPIDVHFDEHPKYDDLGAAEMGLIACAITRANRTLSDGRIPRRWPERRFGKEGSQAAETLVQKGIWRRLPDGDYEIVGYLDHNYSRAYIESRRQKMTQLGRKGGQLSATLKRHAERDGQASRSSGTLRDTPTETLNRHAERHAQPDTDTDTDTKGISLKTVTSVGAQPENPVFTKESERIPKNAQADGAFGLAVSAVGDGIRSVTGKPFVLPPPGSFELGKLVLAIRQHHPDDATRVEWARSQAIAFAKYNRGKLSAHSFIDWLNSPTPEPAQNEPGTTNGTQETPEQHWERVKREEAALDAAQAKRNEGAGPPPEPLSVVMARLRAAQLEPPKESGE